jgi:hypothetical protein
MQVGTIVAVQPDRRNGIPWFGKVTASKNEHVEVIWLHKLKSNSKYFYLSKTTDTISKETIICHGIDFEPCFKDGLLWRLLTPLSFIQALNPKDDTTPIPTILSPLTHVTSTPNKISFDITQLAFPDKEAFEMYINNYK